MGVPPMKEAKEQNPMPVFMGGTPMPRLDTTIPLFASSHGRDAHGTRLVATTPASVIMVVELRNPIAVGFK